MIRIAALVLLIGIGFLVPKAAGTVSTAQTSRLPNTQLTHLANEDFNAWSKGVFRDIPAGARA